MAYIGNKAKHASRVVEYPAFTAGVSTTLVLAGDPGSTNACDVLYDGNSLAHDKFSVTGPSISLVDPVPNTTTKVEVIYALNVFTGSLTYVPEAETSFDLGNTTGTADIDMVDGNVFYATSTGVTTWTFSGAAASGTISAFTLELTNGGAYTQTWPASVDWPNGVAPTLTAAGVDILVFYTRDGGTTWRGGLSEGDSK